VSRPHTGQCEFEAIEIKRNEPSLKKRDLCGIHGAIAPMSENKGNKAASEGSGPPPDPFAALAGLGNLPAGPEDSKLSANAIPAKTSQRGQKNTNRGRVDIVRQTAHRGGKAVTVAKNFTGIGLAEKQELAKKMQKACGVGGTVKDGCIEIQGDKREEMKRILTEAGFKPVFAGG
jgi:translation initiation factor 1